MKVDMLLSNDESRQLLVDSETLVSGLLDKICKDELLTPSFYTIHYVIPAHTPVPLTCKMANLHSNQLRLVDRRGTSLFLVSIYAIFMPPILYSTIVSANA